MMMYNNLFLFFLFLLLFVFLPSACFSSPRWLFQIRNQTSQPQHIFGAVELHAVLNSFVFSCSIYPGFALLQALQAWPLSSAEKHTETYMYLLGHLGCALVFPWSSSSNSNSPVSVTVGLLLQWLYLKPCDLDLEWRTWWCGSPRLRLYRQHWVTPADSPVVVRWWWPGCREWGILPPHLTFPHHFL